MSEKKNNSTTSTFHYVAGLDIGNGYTKGLIGPQGDDNPDLIEAIDMPSVSMLVTKPNLVPTADINAPTVVNEDFYNNLDVHFDTPLVTNHYRRLLGRRALTASGDALDEFDLNDKTSKADQELSKVLVLGIIAGKAVKDYVTATGSIPNPANDNEPSALKVHASVALALPINEYVHHREQYAASFTGAGDNKLVHTVTLDNFDTPVTVKVICDHVVVIAEGASAQYAISSYGEPLADALLAEVRERGLELPGVTGADIHAVTDTVGVDVGEGTVNFPVFTGGEFNKDASRAFNKGYGTILENAIRTMEDTGFNTSFTSRKQLADFLQRTPPVLKRKAYDQVMVYVQEQAQFFVDALVEQFTRVMNDVGMFTEVVFVYGGGSGPIRELLYPALMEKVAELNAAGETPVLYMDAAYSRKLNREGLMIAAKTVANS